MKKITRFIVIGLVLMSANVNSQTARLQVIHNCADLAAATVDVYVNNSLLLDNFAFRTATPFIDAPAGVPLSIDVAPSNSTSSADGIYNLTATLTANEKYILVANGIVSPTGYSPTQAFQLSVFGLARENAANPANTDVLVNHGSTDAPTVDVVETSIPAGVIVDNISYPSFTGDYLELPTGDYLLDVTNASGTTVVASYLAPLSALGLNGAALVVLASGFLDPSQNSGGPAFGLWVALPSGGDLIPLPMAGGGMARVQVIHNCADLAAATVDVYLNQTLLLDNFAFRTATPFIDAPAGVPLSIDVAPSNSTSSADGIYTLTATLANGEKYILVANGIVSGTGYSPAPAFELSVFGLAREAASNLTNTDILVNHGSTDAPTVDVVEISVPAGTIVDNISYPSFTSSYLELPTADYILNVTDASGSTVVASYQAPLSTLGLNGAALTVLASGFLNPLQNSNGPAFGLWVALASGGALIPLPAAPLAVNENDLDQIRIYPNPTSAMLNIDLPFSYDQAKAEIIDISGRRIVTVSALEGGINVSDLSDGIYVLSLEIDGIKSNLKFVIDK